MITHEYDAKKEQYCRIARRWEIRGTTIIAINLLTSHNEKYGHIGKNKIIVILFIRKKATVKLTCAPRFLAVRQSKI